MKLNNKNLPKLIFAAGVIAIVIAYLLTAIVMKPVITEQDFEYSITYTHNGETIVLEDVYTCSFIGNGRDGDPKDRYYDGAYKKSTEQYHPGAVVIDEKDGLELRIVTSFSNDYLMGDGDGFDVNDIYMAAYDDMGVEYTDADTLAKFDAEIVSYVLPTPIENSLVFGGFSRLHDLSMAVMYAVSILVLIACMIFVKRDEGVEYKVLDKISVVLNFIISIFVIPFTMIIIWWSQIFISTDSLVYQLDLCVPAVGMLAMAASVCLRRNGYSKSGFFVQFAGGVLYILAAIIEVII